MIHYEVDFCSCEVGLLKEYDRYYLIYQSKGCNICYNNDNCTNNTTKWTRSAILTHRIISKLIKC